MRFVTEAAVKWRPGESRVRRVRHKAAPKRARDLGIADKVDSLTPGKRADLILVRTTDITMAPVGDPFDALVSVGQPSNVDAVAVDGLILRRNGRSAALDDRKVARDAMESVAGLRAIGLVHPTPVAILHDFAFFLSASHTQGTIDVQACWFGASGGPQ